MRSLAQIRQKSRTHKRCYSRHVIPFLPVVHSLKRIGNTRAAFRERDGRVFPRSPRCYISALYNNSPTAHFWKLDFCAPGEIFLSSGRCTAMVSVFVIGRPFNRLRCIVCLSSGRSHFRNATSSYFTLGKISFRPFTDCLHFARDSDRSILNNGVIFANSIFGREMYFTSIKKKKRFRPNIPWKQMRNSSAIQCRDQSENRVSKFASCSNYLEPIRDPFHCDLFNYFMYEAVSTGLSPIGTAAVSIVKCTFVPAA